MRSSSALLLLIGSLGFAACSSSGTPAVPPSCSVSSSSNTVTSSTPAPTPASGERNNVMKVTVNGSLCAPSLNQQYPNEICVGVTLCDAGTSNCATINNLLLDTGSYGIRIYLSTLQAAGLNVTSSLVDAPGSGKLAECVGFGDGSSEWGPIGIFDVIMTDSTEKATGVPVHLIKHDYGTPPAACNSQNSFPDIDPTQTGFAGIVGVGLFDRDCGTGCALDASNGMYFACSGTNCGGSTAPTLKQVRNPVAALGNDNNGVILQLPAIPESGASSVDGWMILGIGTQSNNAATNVQAYQADAYGTFTTIFNPFSASELYSFIDSGSSLLFFPWPPPSQPSLSQTVPDCGGGLSGFYCPSGTQSFAATNISYGGSTSSCVGFNVGNANDLLSNNRMVYSNLTGSSGSDLNSDFDWGLPFFLGRKVYTGIRGKSIPGLGTGPLWAY